MAANLQITNQNIDSLAYILTGNNDDVVHLTNSTVTKSPLGTGGGVIVVVYDGAIDFSPSLASDVLLKGYANPSNRAPSLSGVGQLTSIAFSNQDSAGDTVGSIIADGSITDPDVSGAAPMKMVVVGVDNEHGAWQYSLDDGESWTAFADISETNGLLLASSALIRFVPELGWSGDATISYRAWDDSGGPAGSLQTTAFNGSWSPFSGSIATATITVEPNHAPVLTPIADQINPEGSFATLALSATDADGDKLHWTVTGLPSNLTVNQSTGLITGTVDYESSGTYSISVTVADPNGASDTKIFEWIISHTNRPPTLATIAAQNHPVQAVISMQINATDPDQDTVRFAASGLPQGLYIDPDTGIIQGTIGQSAALSNNGAYQVTVYAYDPAGASDSKTFAWQVSNPNQLSVYFTVNTTLDTADANAGNGIAADANGKVSLRAAIEEANAQQLANPTRIFVISFDLAAMGGDTITLSQTHTVTANVRILGTLVAGPGGTQVPAVWLTSLKGGLEFAPTSNSAIEYLGFRGFDDANEPVTFSPVSNQGVLSLLGSVFRDNKTRTSGAAVFNAQAMTVDRTTFEANHANDSGGAIFSRGTMIVHSSQFLSNTASENGGAIQLDANSVTQITSTQFLLNRAVKLVNGVEALRKGGAISLLANAQLYVFSSSFNFNEGGQGGAVYNSGGAVQMVGVSFLGNSGEFGGAIHDSTGVQLWLRGVSFTANNASGEGVLFGSSIPRTVA